VKCPKCGFVSYAGLAQCKKCGYQFVKPTTPGPSSSVTSLFPGGLHSLSPPSTEAPPQPSEHSVGAEPELPAPEAPPAWAPVFPSIEEAPPAALPTAEEPAQGWKEELSERVESFRKRRARLKRGADAAENLELDFEDSTGAGEPDSADDTPESLKGGEPSLDVEFGDSVTPYPQGAPPLETISFEKADADVMHFGTRPMHPEEPWLEGPEPAAGPMEIAVGSSEEVTEAGEAAPEGMLPAPLSRRFLAGLMDAVVLVLGAAVFGIIFWRSGGHMSSSSINYAVLGVVALILIFAYFGLFTALTSTTPGLLLMGYEIRNLHGAYPTPRESFWRAFGILVSLSALTLGFIWAWLDSDTLTWHDRMSGTFITAAWATHETSSLETES